MDQTGRTKTVKKKGSYKEKNDPYGPPYEPGGVGSYEEFLFFSDHTVECRESSRAERAESREQRAADRAEQSRQDRAERAVRQSRVWTYGRTIRWFKTNNKNGP